MKLKCKVFSGILLAAGRGYREQGDALTPEVTPLQGLGKEALSYYRKKMA